MNTKNTLSLILLTSFASCLHGMEGQEEIAKAIFSEPPLIKQKTWFLPFPHATSINNECVAFGKGDSVSLFFPLTGETCSTKFKHPTYVPHTALSQCETLLATTAYDEFVRLWNTQSGKCIMAHKVSEVQIWSALAFSPNGKKLAFITCPGGIHIWQTDPPNKLETYYEDRDATAKLLFIAPCVLAYTRFVVRPLNRPNRGLHNTACSVRLVNIATKKQLGEMPCGTSSIKSLVQAHRQPHIIAALTGYGNCEVWLWNTKEKTPTQALLRRPGADSIALGADGTVLIIGTDRYDHSLYFYALSPDASSPALAKATLLHKMPLVRMSPITNVWCAKNNLLIIHVNGGGELTLWKPSKELQEILAPPVTQEAESEEKAEPEKQATDPQPN